MNIQIEHIKLKRGFGGAKPPDISENFYVRAYENYWKFIIFPFFLQFTFDFSPLLILQKISGGGLSPPSPPPGYAPGCHGNIITINKCFDLWWIKIIERTTFSARHRVSRYFILLIIVLIWLLILVWPLTSSCPNAPNMPASQRLIPACFKSAGRDLSSLLIGCNFAQTIYCKLFCWMISN